MYKRVGIFKYPVSLLESNLFILTSYQVQTEIIFSFFCFKVLTMVKTEDYDTLKPQLVALINNIPFNLLNSNTTLIIRAYLGLLILLVFFFQR